MKEIPCGHLRQISLTFLYLHKYMYCYSVGENLCEGIWFVIYYRRYGIPLYCKKGERAVNCEIFFCRYQY